MRRDLVFTAWTRDIWTWNWAAITAGFMAGYAAGRGFPSTRFRDDAYLGLVETATASAIPRTRRSSGCWH